MPHPYNLKLIVQHTGETIDIPGEIDDEEAQRLNDFLHYADELLNTTLVKNGMPSSVTISWTAESQALTSQAKLPPWDDVIVFLHKLRPLVLQSESTSFENICGILGKAIAHPYFRSMLKEQRQVFEGTRIEEMYQLRINEVLVNSEKTLNIWLNAEEYHRDKDKRELIEELKAVLPHDALRVIFVSLLTEKAKAISFIAGLVSVVLGKQKSITGLYLTPPKQ